VSAAATLLGILAFFGVVLFLSITRLLHICAPNEVLIFVGGQAARLGRQLGYRVIKGGRAFRMPLFEVVERMALTNMPIEVQVRGAYSKGGIPLNVHGIANVKIAGEQPVLDNAIERFLGVPRAQIMAVAKETLEGNLRGVLATLTPEEVNEDKIKFAQSLLTEAEEDLQRLGLELDTLKIQDVSDDVGYLDSIGRRQSAEVQKAAFIAEARSKAESAVRSAQNRQDTESNALKAKLSALRADTSRRLADARTREAALVAEARGEIAAQLAKAQAELDVQRARVELTRRTLQADVLEPARARRSAAEAAAQGAASKIVEQGRATASAMNDLATTWKGAGKGAREVFLLQRIDELVQILMGTIGDLKVDRLTILPAGSTGAGDSARGLLSAAEQLRAVTGVDLVSAVQSKLLGKPSPATIAAPPQPGK
jgi:flotillin